ncbi:MAG: GAF domain-containing sensor histidine kinase [Chloroflexota bacterium]|nr:GAF domain-containing sensor histidine kinase [Chloroflexota bacterium]
MDKKDRRDGQQRLLSTLEQLLAIEGTNVKSALDQASDLIASAINADKSDAFLLDPTKETLVAVGTSHTPMGIRQHQIGLHLLPMANDGPEAAVFNTGECYHNGHVDRDPSVPVGMIRGLGIRSMLIVPLDVAGERRGVVQACSGKEDAFSDEDLSFLEAVSHWVGAVAHRAELVERIAQDAALQARQVVAEELVTVLAHDLRNYITPLKGRLSMMLDRAMREGRERDIEDAEAATRAVRRLQALITDLMDVARLDQGVFSLSREPLNLVTLLQEATGVMQTGKLDIVLRTPDELRVEADPERLKQAIENLIANALRHSPKGMPVDVEVMSQRRDDGEWAIVTITDEGPGITPELMPRLFTRFASGPGSEGLGLGLYLARSIAEAHGGTLTVESSAGKGTRFQLALPSL